jgi:hypothetical protein
LVCERELATRPAGEQGLGVEQKNNGCWIGIECAMDYRETRKGGLYLLLKNGDGELDRRMNVQDTDGQERTVDGGTGLGI